MVIIPYAKLNRARDLWDRLVTVVFYRLFFKRIGHHTTIRRPILISGTEFMEIGDYVSVRDHARLEVVMTGSMRRPRLVIGNGTSIEQNVHIVCGNSIMIGERVLITANCAIVDVTHPYDNVDSNSKLCDRLLDVDSYVEIGDDCMLGIGTVVLPNVRIGKNCVIGANSVVTKDVPPYSVAAGNPARVIKQYDHATRTWKRVEQSRLC